MTVLWPELVLRPGNIVRNIVTRTTKGTMALTKFTQAVSVPAHVWEIEYQNIVVTDTSPGAGLPSQLNWWDAIAAQCDGSANPVSVPLVGHNYGVPAGSVFVDANAGDTTIQIVRIGAPILIGYHFSINDRMYVVASASVSGDLYTCAIRPPLRADVPATTFVGFITIACKCRLADDDQMKLQINSAGIGIGNVKFIEDPT